LDWIEKVLGLKFLKFLSDFYKIWSICSENIHPTQYKILKNFDFKKIAAIDHRGKKRTPGQKIKIITSKHNFFKDWDLKKVEK
jgi:hypothetical protein